MYNKLIVDTNIRVIDFVIDKMGKLNTEFYQFSIWDTKKLKTNILRYEYYGEVYKRLIKENKTILGIKE